MTLLDQTIGSGQEREVPFSPAAEHAIGSLISAFRNAAEQVPAYRRILEEAGVSIREVRTIEDFCKRVPIIDKQATFGRFSVAELCLGGRLERLAAVLTSSGHSGRFSFGLYAMEETEAETSRIDDALDMWFQVRSRPTLMINCLPMGVKVYTRACTLAETSVRPDMVTAVVAQFGRRYQQVILVGEAAFIKHVLELGQSQGIPWRDLLVHVIVGEEPLAENAREYFQGLLGIAPDRPETGLIGSSMGVAELGLNLFFELPHLAMIRRELHHDKELRAAIMGPKATCVPMLMTYDPERLFVEVLNDNRLVVSTLSTTRRLPLIRYFTGDFAKRFEPIPSLPDLATRLGLPGSPLAGAPVLMVMGRGEYATAGTVPVFPEQVKEGLYHDPSLASQITANYRLHSGPTCAHLRIQLSPGVRPSPDLASRFMKSLAQYVPAGLDVRCEPYDSFGSGMTLDYERKFDYLGNS